MPFCRPKGSELVAIIGRSLLSSWVHSSVGRLKSVLVTPVKKKFFTLESRNCKPYEEYLFI